MKITAESLASHLSKRLLPLYVLSGHEPLLVDEALATIRERAQQDGCAEREVHVADRGFDWDAFGAGLQNMSLFAERRLVELRLPGGKPGEAGGRFLTELAANPDTGNVIAVVLPGLDSATSRSRWAGALAEGAVWVELRAPRRDQLPAWLRQRLRKAGLTADDEAVELLAARLEGNLLAAKQEIDKLALLLSEGEKPISAGAIRDAVADGARFDVFQLVDAALAGDPARAVRILNGLEREGEPEALVIWSLAREILTLADVVYRLEAGSNVDQAMNEARVWRVRQDLYRRASRGRSCSDVSALVACAASAEQVIKGVKPGNGWRALAEVVLAFSRGPAALAETA